MVDFAVEVPESARVLKVDAHTGRREKFRVQLAGVLLSFVLVNVGPSICRGSKTQSLDGRKSSATGPRTIARILTDATAIRRGTACELSACIKSPAAHIDFNST